jgi:hypothetical protein
MDEKWIHDPSVKDSRRKNRAPGSSVAACHATLGRLPDTIDFTTS